MLIGATFGTGPVGLLATLAWQGFFRLLALKEVGAIGGRGFFAFATEELILQLAVLSVKALDFGFQVLNALHRAGVLGFPLPGLLAHARHSLAQLPHQVLPVSLTASAARNKKHAVHDSNVCNRNRTGGARRLSNQNGFGGCLPSSPLTR